MWCRRRFRHEGKISPTVIDRRYSTTMTVTVLRPQQVKISSEIGRVNISPRAAGIRMTTTGLPGPRGPEGLLNIEVRTDDPVNPAIGRIWLRADL